MVKTDKSLTVSYMASFALVVAAWGTAFPATTLLSEDFDDGVANGFTEVGGSWSASFGKYFQSMTYPQGPYRSWVAAPTEYTIEVDCRAVSGEQTKVIYAHADTGEEYRVDFWLDRSRLCMPAWGQWWWTRSFEVGGLNLSYARTYHVQIAVSLAGVRVWVDNVLQHDQPWVDGQPLGDAKVGVGTYAAVSGFDNLRVHSYAEDMLPTTWLFEDFNDRVADRFTPIGGEWGIIADEYVQVLSEPPGPYRSWVDVPTEYTIELDCGAVGTEGETKVIYAHADTGEDYRVDFWLDRSRLCIPAWGQGWGTRYVTLGGLSLSYNQTYHVKVRVSVARVKVWVNDALQHDQPWANDVALGNGKVGVGTYGCASTFDNLNVYLGAERAGETWYVNGAVSQSGDGTSWQKAFKTIQKGIDAASHGDTVIVARGTYFENIKFKGKNINLRSTDTLSADTVVNTIIDGNRAGPVVTFAGTEDETCVLSGFAIGNGGGQYGGAVCGGAWEARTRATIRNNTITSSSAARGGGLAWCNGAIQNNWVLSNSATMCGGGLSDCAGAILNNTVSDNSADSGGGLANCDGPILNNTITGNSATAQYAGGGGLWRCDGTIRNNTISENSAAHLGGGLSDCHGPILNNIVSGNSAYSGGGLEYCDSLIEYNTISRNTSTNYGGGLSDCDGPIQNNTISENSAHLGGGLARCGGTLQNNVIRENSAHSGGGLFGCGGTIQGNVICENTARYGGGLAACDGQIQYNSITRNSADSGGGGLDFCRGTIRYNTIFRNSAVSSGGGLAGCGGTVQNNVIRENSADSGGGLYGCGGTIQNNLVCGNSSKDGGGLMYCPGSLRNNTITGNSALDSLRSRGGGLCGCNNTIQNCILWGNNAREGPQLTASAVPSDSCIQGWTGGGVNNIALDPQFVDADGLDDNPSTYYDNNYRLKATSPCVDEAKNEDWMFGALDLDGNNRIFKGANSATVDMGAYEYGSFPFKITNVQKTPAFQVQLTWTSRPGDNYTVLSRTSLPGWAWVNEATVPSQGSSTVWAGSSTAGPIKFYRIELK